ncbi:MAG: hypothetical protein KAI97_01760 [Gemmatimonadetes bacterium]|nr:hypothetical protein [Gemmatimonadota bacterium]
MAFARSSLAFALFVGALTACSTETQLTMDTSGQNAEGETVALSNVSLDILPYDIDELYAELQSQSQPGEPPSADAIRRLSQQYQDECSAYRATSDSIEAVQARASSISDRTSDEYRQAFEAYQALVAREKQRFQSCQDITDGYTGVREEYREKRRAWEERAWPEDAFAAAESERVGEMPLQSVETNPDGRATVTVPNGAWWILGDAPVPGSISQRYRWNVRVEASGGEQAVGLTGENASLEPVY